VPLILRLALNENWSELSARGDVLDHRFVDRFFMLEKERKYCVHQLGRNFAADLVALHDNSPQGMGYTGRLVQRFFCKEILELFRSRTRSRYWGITARELNRCLFV
jgi:hypothetical protein